MSLWCISVQILYSVAIDRGCLLAHVGRWINSKWEWKLGWRRNLFVWENDHVAQLMGLLDNKKLVAEGESVVDNWFGGMMKKWVFLWNLLIIL